MYDMLRGAGWYRSIYSKYAENLYLATYYGLFSRKMFILEESK